MSGDLAGLVNLFVNILTLAIIGRVIASWVDPGFRSQIGRVIYDITEPLIAPIRRVVPPMGMFDFSTFIALLLLQLVGRLLHQALAA
jgi:YggT family protein